MAPASSRSCLKSSNGMAGTLQSRPSMERSMDEWRGWHEMGSSAAHSMAFNPPYGLWDLLMFYIIKLLAL